MVDDRSIIVSLTGGLGNQLFQLANALNLDSNREIRLEWAIGKPRTNSAGLPEICSFNLPSRVKILEYKSSPWIVSKSSGYVLRQGVNPKFFEKSYLYTRVVRKVAESVISIWANKKINLSVCEGTGYTKLDLSGNTNWIIGYFQTYIPLNDLVVLEELRKMKLVDQSESLLKLVEIAKIEKPIIVHVRLGDYRNEKLFGIPEEKYYEKAIGKLMEKYPESKLWIFTDEEEGARKIISPVFGDDARWILDVDGSSATTLLAMQLGIAYVIANSTFSWWAAALSQATKSDIIAPRPWFRFEKEPLELVPILWHRMSAWS